MICYCCYYNCQRLQFADFKKVKEEFDAQLFAILGEKTDADKQKTKSKVKKENNSTSASTNSGANYESKTNSTASPADMNNADPSSSSPSFNPFSQFPKPHENYKVHTHVNYSPSAGGYTQQFSNSSELLSKHLRETGGQVITRFPPEPNGYLHIGHAKACFIDFGLAESSTLEGEGGGGEEKRKGKTYLRFDDTNPEAEKMEYIEHIIEIVQWLGWKWEKVGEEINK